MKLLTAEETKRIRRSGDEERAARTQKLREEETKASKSLNEKISFVESEKSRLDAELAEHEKKTKARVHELTSEVVVLEQRKREALAPTKDRELAVSRREDAITEKESSLSQKEKDLDDKIAEARLAKENYLAEKSKLDKYKQSIDEYKKKVDQDHADNDRLVSARESMLRDEQKRLRAYFEEQDAILNNKLKQ